jgi:hypothetical protein
LYASSARTKAAVSLKPYCPIGQPKSLHAARVVVEKPTESRAATDSTDRPHRASISNQLVVEPLVVPLAMIVLDELRDGAPEVPLTDGNDPIETFLFQAPNAKADADRFVRSIKQSVSWRAPQSLRSRCVICRFERGTRHLGPGA